MRDRRVSLFLFLLAGLVVQGCSQGSPLHSRYNNFLAYFNTYYNAKQKMEEGIKSIEQRERTIDRTRLVSIFPRPSQSGQNTVFEEAIEKAAELLRNRPDSKYADDALFLIGKAYFYQQNFVGAEEKFRETLLLVEEQEDAKAIDEARFWLARTLSAASSFDEGASVLSERLGNEDVDRSWKPRLRLAMGELLAQAGRFEEAAGVLQEAAAHVDDRDDGARAAMLLGQIYEELERFEEAVAAYQLAESRNPDYAITYAARLNRALVLGLDLERHAEALGLVEEMKSDGKNYDQRAEVELTYARLLAASGQRGMAQSRFDAVLYDEALGGSSIRGEVHYRLAEWHRDVWKDYVRAAAHFDTASSAIRTPTDAAETRFTRESMLDADKEARRYGAYAEAAANLAGVDSLLELAYLDDAAFQNRIAEIEEQRRAEYFANLERRGDIEDQQRFGGAVAENLTQRGKTTGEPSTAISEESGFLGHRSPPTVESGRVAFETTWGSRPLVPNWRRQAVISVAQLVGEGSGRQVASQETQQGGPPPLDLSAVPRTDEGRAELEMQRADRRYELANALFLGLNLPDSAQAVYHRILQETPEAPAAVRARYALAEMAREEDRPDEAQSLYRQVADLSTDGSLRNAAREQLGEEASASADDNSEANRAFETARRMWDTGDPDGAVASFVDVADTYPDSNVAPNALYAAAAAVLEGSSGGNVASGAVDIEADSMMVGLAMVPIPEALRSGVSTDVAEAEAPVEQAPEPDARVIGLAAVPEALAGDAVEVESKNGHAAIELLDRLIEAYPQSKAATRAGDVRTALAVSLGLEKAPEEPAGDPTAGKMEAQAFGLRGDVPIRASASGYTILIQEAPSLSASRLTQRQLESQQIRVATAQRLGEAGGYLVVAGQFESEEVAQAAMAVLPEARDMEILQLEEPSVISVGGLEIVEEQKELEVDEDVVDRRLVE